MTKLTSIAVFQDGGQFYADEDVDIWNAGDIMFNVGDIKDSNMDGAQRARMLFLEWCQVEMVSPRFE